MNKNSKMVKIFKLSGIILCALIFTSLTILVYFHKDEPLGIDASIRDFFYNIRGEKYGFIYWFFRIITEFGNLFLIILILIFILFYTKMDFRFFLTCFGLMLAIIINVGLKDLYNRERPFEEMRWAYEFSSSFPSGHSTAAGFLYTFLIYLVYHLDIKKWKKSSFTVGAVLLIILVMISRLVLGVHYFLDVIAGCATGIMVSCLCMLLYRYCVNNDILTKGLFERKR